MLHRQDLPNNWFKKRLKRMAMFFSIFGKRILPGWFYCLNSHGNFEITYELS